MKTSQVFTTEKNIIFICLNKFKVSLCICTNRLSAYFFSGNQGGHLRCIVSSPWSSKIRSRDVRDHVSGSTAALVIAELLLATFAWGENSTLRGQRSKFTLIFYSFTQDFKDFALEFFEKTSSLARFRVISELFDKFNLFKTLLLGALSES